MSKNIIIQDENEQYMEQEIQNILSNITETEYKSFDEIEELKNLVIDKVYSDFMNYEANAENKEHSKHILRDYEFVDMEDINVGDYLKYFNIRAFYNLKLVDAGIVLKKYDNGKILFKKLGKFNTIKPNFFFRRINKDTLVKMKLLDIVNKS
tara:strand:+ start:646 stop:1101 length:456 start_codon:yes stop_codon:yes gene_type:complete